MFTAFPELTTGASGIYYFKMQFPVGVLGALFDSFSFFITVSIIRHALESQKSVIYFAHLFIDLVIAILATFWVLFVFSSAGWLISLLESTPLTLSERNSVYKEILQNAIAQPYDNFKNIYFGLIMGVSASLPTCVHLFMFIRSSFQSVTIGRAGGHWLILDSFRVRSLHECMLRI